MKKMKNFQSFNKSWNEGYEKITKYLSGILTKSNDFANDVWEATKRESKETKLAVNILSRMLSGEKVRESEKEFLKEQSKDLVRILPLVAISGLPIPIPITPFLIVLGKKYGFDILPKDHRSLLKSEIKLPETLQKELETIPETGMGYHLINVILKNGRIVRDLVVMNSSILLMDSENELNVDDIEDIFVS